MKFSVSDDEQTNNFGNDYFLPNIKINDKIIDEIEAPSPEACQTECYERYVQIFCKYKF